MRVIVSTELSNIYTKYTLVDSIAKVLELSEVECIVIHSCADDDVTLASTIKEIRKKFNCSFFYISTDLKAVITLLVNGIQGTILEDDFYYDSEVELDNLLESYGIASTALTISDTQSSLAVVKEFITSFARGDDKCSLPYFLSQTNTALSELESVIGKQELQIHEMGSSAIEVFQRASEYITVLEERNKLFSNQLEAITQQMQSPRNRFGSSGVSLYSTVKYNPPTTKKMLTIREFSFCRYLTSFILSYQSYLKIVKNKRVKVIFTVQKGRAIYTKYSSGMFTFISQESLSKIELYSNDIIVTNAPQSQVLTRIIESGTYDIVIVIDRLYGADTILSGTNVKHLSAVGGTTDLTRFKLSAKSCIFSHLEYPNAFLTIPTISKYPPAKVPDMRISAYGQMCSSCGLYDKLDKFLGV